MLAAYYLRLLMLVVASAGYGASRFFIKTPWFWERFLVMAISLVCLLPFYATGLFLTGSKLFALFTAEEIERKKEEKEPATATFTSPIFVVDKKGKK
jgi:hypothetical protein